jgi:hypothetical protein
MEVLDWKKIGKVAFVGICLTIHFTAIDCKESLQKPEEKRKFTDRMLDCVGKGEKKCLNEMTDEVLYAKYDFVYFIFRKDLKKRIPADKVKDFLEYEGDFNDFYLVISEKGYEEEYFKLISAPPRKSTIKEKARLHRQSYKDISDVCGANPIWIDAKSKKIQKQKCIMLGEIENDDFRYQINYTCDDFEKEKNCRIVGVELL